MGSAGSSVASSGRDFASTGKSRPAGCPKDSLFFKPSHASPRLNGVVPDVTFVSFMADIEYRGLKKERQKRIDNSVEP
jgi:hypothetical protein